MAEAGDLRRFGHERHFLKFCGLALSISQSAGYRGGSKISKRANGRPKPAGWMAATIATWIKENIIRKKVDRYVQADPLNADLQRKAYTACAAKMARIVYRLIKHQESYRSYLGDAVSHFDGRTRSHGPWSKSAVTSLAAAAPATS